MEAARQEFRDKMAQYNLALAQMAGVAERLKNQIKNKTARAQELERRILANHQAGNLELAGTLARELQELKADLTTDTNELQETETAYQGNLRQAKLVQKEFEDKVNKLQKQLSQVKIKEAASRGGRRAEQRGFQSRRPWRFDEDCRGGPYERYERSAGKARVAADLVNMDQIQEKEAERKALEQSALAEFLASQGIQSPASTEAPPRPRRSGPAAEELIILP